MYKRLIILSVIILSALCGLTALGYHAVQKWAQGLQGARLGEFAEVAEQIRQDVKRKLDEFIRAEQNRPYTDYNPYYVPENIAPGQRQMPLLRSPLAGRLDNSFAWGNFQIQPNGSIITPNDGVELRQAGSPSNEDLYTQVRQNKDNIEQNLLPMLNGLVTGSFRVAIGDGFGSSSQTQLEESRLGQSFGGKIQSEKDTSGGKGKGQAKRSYPIESLQPQEQETQVVEQQRTVFMTNTALNQAALPPGQIVSPPIQQAHTQMGLGQTGEQMQAESSEIQAAQMDVRAQTEPQPAAQADQTETVQVRIDPFIPVVVNGPDAEQSIFAGQVFLLRHVQIENQHFLQGFQLNENKLIEEIEDSASLFCREGMTFELSKTEDQNIAYAAILDFGFGDLVLNLAEMDPQWIAKQTSQLRYWYFGIITVVLCSVTVALASLWRNARAQLKLAQKKDDFISAVSHELRTPLTSIRMYSEMLEKNWVKSSDKLTEYYSSMRTESERLSRLIENVLDFSRIQKGKKKYTFKLGDLNQCITALVEMMTPYAAQNGFVIKTELGPLGQTAFDHDAVTQIAVNLLDNAIKYARNAQEKTITVRTKRDRQFTVIEVEDHGPGVPHHQRKKVFDEFYRCGPEATRETAGTGLGLALVKNFAQAHNGFVEIITSKPTGAVFRVALSADTN
jgi:signal transduction histidine kinase